MNLQPAVGIDPVGDAGCRDDRPSRTAPWLPERLLSEAVSRCWGPSSKRPPGCGKPSSLCETRLGQIMTKRLAETTRSGKNDHSGDRLGRSVRRSDEVFSIP